MFKGNPEQTGTALSRARRSGKPADVDLRWITSMQDAQDVQDVAFDCLGGTPVGYTLAATSAVTSRLLNCSEPIVGKMLEEYVYDSGSSIRLPYRTLGVGAQFIFVIGSPLREPVSLGSVSDSVLSCRMGLQLLGRRVTHGVPLHDWSATADFALDLACVRGDEVEGWDRNGLDAIEVSLRIGGNEVARGSGDEVFGDPVVAVLRLAQSLQARGVTLQVGDVVATGSCTGLAQVVPGQRVRGVFDGRGEVDLDLT